MSYYLEVITKNPLYRSPGKVADLAMLEPVTRAAVCAIIAEAKAEHAITLIAFETYRSRERQLALYDQGATRLRQVGVHHYGLACDLVRMVEGEPTWKGDYGFLGVLAVKHGLIWGGDWGQPGRRHGFIDADHVQRCSLADQPRLFAGAWFPEPAYHPSHAALSA